MLAVRTSTNSIQLFGERFVGKNVKATIPKGNIGNDQYTVPNDCSSRTYCSCFPLTLANICPWPPVTFFQISLKNSALKTTHNTFRECRLHFFDKLSRNSCLHLLIMKDSLSIF